MNPLLRAECVRRESLARGARTTWRNRISKTLPKETTARRAKSGAGSPTLEDVARLAGVSTATVSRCLNSPDQVVERTRDRVLKIVKDIGYAPNFGARALAARRTNTVGVVIPTMENAIFARGLQAFQEELGRHGFTLLVASSSYQPDLETSQVRTLLARGADALMLIGFERHQEVYDILERRGVPYVISWAYRAGDLTPAIGFDNRVAMSALARQVTALGHRRIAVISAPQAENDRARDRVFGVMDACREVGIDPDSVSVLETPYSVENGAAAMERLMSGPHRPTAVICGNDVLAVGAVRAAKRMGLRVPGDVSVTGFDDIEIAQIVEPPLTTVHVPHRQMGTRAAQMIVSLLHGGPHAPAEPLETHIVDRTSLGPAPQS